MSDRSEHVRKAARYCTCDWCLDERAEYSKPEYHDDFEERDLSVDDFAALANWTSREWGPE